jgi:HSP20 family molecular chaperone IbpA
MADVIINKKQKGSRLRGQAQGQATECARGMAQPSPTPFCSLTLRDLFTASLSELMRRFTEDIDRLFEGRSWSTAVKTLWSPSISISERDGEIKVCAELPGLSKDDVTVELAQDGLIISGERPRKLDDRREGMYWSDGLCSSFTRTIPIPDEAQVEKATAKFENEILTVTVPLPGSRESGRRLFRVCGVALEAAQALN